MISGGLPPSSGAMDAPFRLNLLASDGLDESTVGERPPVTVRDVLRLALPRGTAVVGGDAGLENAVTWARLIHLDLPSLERLERGELALAALPAQSEAPHALLATILQTLAGRGISALAVTSPVAPGAQALADAIGTPLLALPADARLGEIEKSVVSLVINRHAQLEQRGVQIFRQLAQQTIENRGIEAIIKTLAEITAKPVALEDSDGNLEMYHSPPRWPISLEELVAALLDTVPALLWFVGYTLSIS